jgi:hypothetical protein
MRLIFDRGTIVVLGLARADPANRTLPGALWDPRIAAVRCPARYHAELVAELKRRRVQFTDEVVGAPASGLPESVQVELRPYQEAALAAWALSNRRGTAVLPTGSGKTRLAIAAIARSGVPALCLVPTRVLLDQWVQSLRQLLGIEPGQLGDGEHRIEAVTVATFESAWRHMHRLGNQFGLLVVDEAHHFGTGMRDEALDMCTAPWRMGLTATKPAGPAAARLDELVGRVVYELRIDDLAGEFLAPFETVVLHLELTEHERGEYASLMATFGEAMRRFKRFAPGATWDEFQAKLRGLLCTVNCARDAAGNEDASLEISGPFTVFRHTLLYGRALGELVRFLPHTAHFHLRADCVLREQAACLHLQSGDPIFPAEAPKPFDSKLEARFARDFARAAPDWDLLREPEPIPAGRTLIFPDFRLRHRLCPERTFLLEIAGFWSADYLRRKLTLLREAAIDNLILCVDSDRSCGDEELPAGASIVRFRRRIDPHSVLAVAGGPRPSLSS